MPNLSPEVIAAAQAAQRKWKVWASVGLVQFIVESAWGTKMPAGSNNPFGIKAVPGQASVSASTREYIGGRYVTMVQQFAVYKNFDEAFDAHAKLLATHSAYAEAMAHAYGKNNGGAEEFIDGLGRYATDPNYRATLKSVARANNLYRYDTLTTPAVPAPGQVPVPEGIPAPVILAVLWVLGNIFGGTVSSVVGILAAAYALAPPQPPGWQVILGLAAVLVFGVGGRATAPVVPAQVPEEVEGDKPVLDPKILTTILSDVVPVLEKVVPLLSQIEPVLKALNDKSETLDQRLAAVENFMKAIEGATADNNALGDLMSRLQNLKGNL